MACTPGTAKKRKEKVTRDRFLAISEEPDPTPFSYPLPWDHIEEASILETDAARSSLLAYKVSPIPKIDRKRKQLGLPTWPNSRSPSRISELIRFECQEGISKLDKVLRHSPG